MQLAVLCDRVGFNAFAFIERDFNRQMKLRSLAETLNLFFNHGLGVSSLIWQTLEEANHRNETSHGGRTSEFGVRHHDGEKVNC